ncbi:hypothetical protein D9619_002545 [Psilocybe cf. subviscida]|uniref:Uncharacterized protein n=1 Tax=Psilocybe cf. subviscida TaxID=2480587 RepID=A0A8H5AVZ3_9AGAR|nr:hypothetical protein D9619_002545 [Psilocybe cf. subviscida]
MSFLTDTAWPAGLLKIFDICQQQPSPANQLYGPYTKLFSYCFGNSFDFVVTPVDPPSELSSSDDAESTAALVVFRVDVQPRPVLLAEIKDGVWLTRADLRFKATEHMRQRYEAMVGECPLPRLWGLSLLGTSLRVYCSDVATGDIKPAIEGRPSPGRALPSDFLEGAWDVDILSQEGFDTLKKFVKEIMGAAAAQ